MIPTYNEKENILPLIDEINSLGIKNLEILIADDNSPDGTWKLVEEKKKTTKNIRLLRRFQNKGRGFAGIDGFREALRLGADRIIEMDGDFSHSPEHIPALLKAADDADVVLGSRFVEGGKLERESRIRNVVTALAVKYLNLVLGYRKIKDPTSGYRCFKKETLEKIKLNTLKAADPFVVTETLYRCKTLGLEIAEIPITFRDRAAGKSKLGSGKLIKYLFRVIKLRFTRF
jgi:dolichol-phosphate mannosyltransferase